MPKPSTTRQEVDPIYREKIFSKFGTLSRFYLKFLQPLCLQQYNLNTSAFRVLSNIAWLAPVGASEIGQHTSLEADKVTRAVNALVEQGFVDRSSDNRDRRRIVLKLTPEGAQVYREIAAVGAQYEAKLFSDLTDREVASLLQIVDKLIDKAVKDIL